MDPHHVRLDPNDRDAVKDVLDLAIAQDNITWLVLSVFVVAQTVVFSAAINDATPPRLRALATALGIFLTTLALLLLWRSNRYLEAYWGLLSCTGLPRFNLRIGGIRAWSLIIVLHVGFYLGWGVIIGTLISSG